MATQMISEVCDALIEAGASEPKARAAAEAVAAHEHWLAKLVVIWMATTNVVLIVIVLGKLFFGH